MARNNKELTLNLQKSINLHAMLMEKQFQLSDVGLSDKIAFDWTRAGLYLEEKKTTGRRKYNAIEYVWLRLVKDLREFGLSYDAIRNLRTFLLSPINIREMLIEALSIEANEDETLLKEIQKELSKIVASSEELKQAFDSNESPLMNTVLCYIINSCVLQNENFHLLIKKDGHTILYDGNNIFDTEINAGDILNGPYISYPISHVLTEFLAREDLMESPLGRDGIELSADEKKVLDLLRQGNLVSLSVKLNNKEIKLIEIEEEIDIKDVKGKLVDFIKRNSYSEITYKTEKGKIVSMKRKTKFK